MNRLQNITTSTDHVEYCHLCFARLHCTSTCPLLGEATRNLIIYQRHQLGKHSIKELCSRGNRIPRHSGEATTNTYRPENRGSEGKGRTTPNTHHPGKRSPWSSGEATLSTRTSVTVTKAADPLAQTASMQSKTKSEGQQDSELRTITPSTQ